MVLRDWKKPSLYRSTSVADDSMKHALRRAKVSVQRSVTKYDDNAILAWIVPMNCPSGDGDDCKMILWMRDNDAIGNDKVLQLMR